MDALKEVRRLSELKKLRCGETGCRAVIGLGETSLLNIRRLTKTGVEPSVYQVTCPRFWDYETCMYRSLVVFVSPEADDPEDLALEATTPHLESWCAHCKRTLDWSQAKVTWKEDFGEEFLDEVELSIRCRMTWGERFQRMLGRRVIRHSHVRNVRWIEDDEDEEDDIPDHLPSDWLISPVPTSAEKRTENLSPRDL